MTFIDFIWLVASVLGIFTIVILITRVFGLRTFAKMSSFDFASTIAVGSVLASIILNANYSLLKGAVVLVAIIGFQTLFSYLVRTNAHFKSWFTNKPQIIMWNGKILHKRLKACNVGESDLIAKLREANVHDFKEVKAVIFESTGDVSVIHNNSDKDVAPQILNDVNTEGL
ncbi:MAG: YetF domain-containing protein [Winogradskyella arenosi]